MDNCTTGIYQIVRVVDVVVLGPAMIKGGTQIRGPLGTFLTFAGIATIIFNGLTFLDIERTK